MIFSLYAGMAVCIFTAGFSVAKLLDRPKRNKSGKFVKRDGSYKPKRKNSIVAPIPLSKDY